MEFLKTAWAWFNGNKMVIGATCLALAPFFPESTFAYEVLLYVGSLFGGVGFLHKLVKGVDNT